MVGVFVRPRAGGPLLEGAIAEFDYHVQVAVGPSLSERLTPQRQRCGFRSVVADPFGQLDRLVSNRERLLVALGPDLCDAAPDQRFEPLRAVELRQEGCQLLRGARTVEELDERLRPLEANVPAQLVVVCELERLRVQVDERGLRPAAARR